MKSKKLLATLIALVLVVVGIAVAGVGIHGRSYYTEATELIGCKAPDTINYILDTSLIEEVNDELSADQFADILKHFGADEAAIGEAVAAHTDYLAAVEAEAEAAKAAKEAEEAGEEAPAAEPVEPATDETMIALAQQSVGNLPNISLFNNAIMYMFLGIVIFIVGAAILFIQLMDDSRKGKARSGKANPKAAKVGEFFLNYALYIILGLMLVVVCIARPNFLDVSNLLNIIKQASTKGILALGCAGLIVLAGTDLSIGRVLGVSAAVTASLVQSVDYASRMFPQMTHQLPLWLPLLASIAVAVVFCLFNGFGVAKLHLHAFIVTLGTQLIAQGLCCIYIESQPSGTAQALSTFDRNFLNFAAGNLNIGSVRIPLVVIYFAIIAVIMWFVWNKTRLGKNMFAVGGNTEAAAVSGVNVAKTIMLVYLIAGILYGTSAYLEAARITSVGANTGLNYETDAISACVVGGVSFSGGVGTIQGVVIGAILLQAINYSLQFLGVNPYIQYVVRGLIIILAVSIDVRKYIAKK